MLGVKDFVIAALDEVRLQRNWYFDVNVVEFLRRNKLNFGMILRDLVE